MYQAIFSRCIVEIFPLWRLSAARQQQTEPGHTVGMGEAPKKHQLLNFKTLWGPFIPTWKFTNQPEYDTTATFGIVVA